MILYLDSSALVPLLVAEPSSERCGRLWDQASRYVSSRVSYVEVAAALASAERAGRLTANEFGAAREGLDLFWNAIDVVEVDEALTAVAASYVRSHALRGYDAIQCASAVRVSGESLVAASGDRRLISAWQTLGLMVADTVVG